MSSLAHQALARGLRTRLLVILGATATGKSKLAVDLALRYNGEIINSDAMQLYTGIPITTNKMPVSERMGIPHHLTNSIDLSQVPWTVSDYVEHAIQKIADIQSRGKLPIVVGGTHYYLQGLLFQNSLIKSFDATAEADARQELSPEEAALLQSDSDTMFRKLEEVDPAMAMRWHPNDRRRIQRSLEIWFRTGRRASDIYAEQKAVTGQCDSLQAGDTVEPEAAPAHNSMRYDALLLWSYVDSEALKASLDQRVDTMVSSGLLSEANEVFEYASAQEKNGIVIDKTRGIWVAIGLKEFEEYCTQALQDSLSKETLEILKEQAIERTKISTHQYMRRQLRWIRLKLLLALHGAHALGNLFLLECDAAGLQYSEVLQTASGLVMKFLDDANLPEPRSLSATANALLNITDTSDVERQFTKQSCDICGVTLTTEESYQSHTKSRKHIKCVRRRTRTLDKLSSNLNAPSEPNAAST